MIWSEVQYLLENKKQVFFKTVYRYYFLERFNLSTQELKFKHATILKGFIGTPYQNIFCQALSEN